MRQLLLLSIIYMCSANFGQALICGKGPSDLTYFGPSCEYLCHCGGNKCDRETGKCPSGVQCDPGWMGSGCQQVNIAYNASVENYHSDHGLNVVDGRESTCTTFTNRDGKTAYLILDLGRKVNILEVDLVNPNASGDSLLKFGISFSEDNVMFRPYYWYQRIEFPVTTEPVRRSDIVRFVRIEPNGTEGISTLCEIEITGECDHFYAKCSTPCGHCASGEQCNKVTGHCDASGCADGWQTFKCDKACNDTYYGNCMTKCGHCRHSAICDKINGSCPLELCSDGWHGERCDKEIYALKEPVNVGVIAGTVSAVVGVIIVIVISVVTVKTRRRRETTEKQKDTSSQKVDNIEHDISKTYYNTEDSRKQRSEPIHKTEINSVKRGPDVSLHCGYEKLRDRMGTEELPYSEIDHVRTDNNGRSSLENACYYNEEFSSTEER